ncbi:MAG: SDR family NAD(P)-dependent oxidoreductase [Acidimicrobiia bacterium]
MSVDSLGLSGRVALVTGGSKGIGRGIATGLAGAGVNVAVIYKNDESAAEETCQQIEDAGSEVLPIRADIGERDEFQSAIDLVVSRLGRIDILVNNAARTRFGPLFETADEDFDDVIATVLKGPFFGTLAAARHMERQGGGSVINITSIAVTGIMPFHGAYTVAKGGLEAMTRQFALELAPIGVRVNAISPGATLTQRNLEYDPDFARGWASVTPMGRVAKPEDYVGATRFLSSDASAFITGQILQVDGGWTLRGAAPNMDDFDFSQERHRG